MEDVKLVKRYLKLKKPLIKKQHSSKKGWVHVGNNRIYFKSTWEVRMARHLQDLFEKKAIQLWQYEPEEFWFHEIKRGTRTYLPDFKVIRNDDSHYWIEVKGYLDPKSITKIKRFRKYYPQEQLFVLTNNWFRAGSILPNLTQGNYENPHKERMEKGSTNV